MADTKIVGGSKIVRGDKREHHKKKHHEEHHEHKPDFAGCHSVKSPIFITVCGGES